MLMFLFLILMNGIGWCPDSSAGESDSLVSCRSRVRIPPGAFLNVFLDFLGSKAYMYYSCIVVLVKSWNLKW